MDTNTRTSHACTLETLNEDLKAAMRAHGAKYGLGDIESDVLMCCETVSLHQKKGFSVVTRPHDPQSMLLRSGWCGRIALTETTRMSAQPS